MGARPRSIRSSSVMTNSCSGAVRDAQLLGRLMGARPSAWRSPYSSGNPLGQYGLGLERLPQGPEYPGAGVKLAPGFCGGTMAAPAGVGAWTTRTITAASVRKAAALLKNDKIEPSASATTGASVSVASCLSNLRPHQVSALRGASIQPRRGVHALTTEAQQVVRRRRSGTPRPGRW